MAQYGELLPEEIRISDDCLGEPSILRMYGFLQALEKVQWLSQGFVRRTSGTNFGVVSKRDWKTGESSRRDNCGSVLRGDYHPESSEREGGNAKKNVDTAGSRKNSMWKSLWETRIFSYESQKIPEKAYTKWFDYDKIKKNSANSKSKTRGPDCGDGPRRKKEIKRLFHR